MTGVGLVSPFGGDTDDFFARIMRGESAVTLYRHPALPTDLAQPVVHCASFNSEQIIGRTLSSVTDRYSQFGLAAAFSAWSDAGLSRTGTGSDDYGVSWGTGVGGALTYEKGYTDFFERGKRRMSPLTVALAMNNAAASNLAIAMSQLGHKVLLVDTDIRKGRLHECYHLSNEKGIGEYLTGHLRLDEVLQAADVPNLSFVTCGQSVIDSSQLLGSKRMSEFIQ